MENGRSDLLLLIRIHARDEVMVAKDGPLLEESIKVLHDKRVLLHGDESQYPSRDFLAQRFELLSRELNCPRRG